MQAEIEAPVRGELFKVVDGQIVAIETVLRNVPLGADMGWGPASRGARIPIRVPNRAGWRAGRRRRSPESTRGFAPASLQNHNPIGRRDAVALDQFQRLLLVQASRLRQYAQHLIAQ